MSDESRWLTAALAGIRLTNGSLALVAPTFMTRRLGMAGSGSRASTYVLRMFGIRTVLIGLDLVTGTIASREAALKRAPMIHAIDASAALAATRSGALPPRAGAMATAISLVNLALALGALWQRRGASGDRPRRRLDLGGDGA